MWIYIINPQKLIQIVKDLRAELQMLKEDNKRIIRAQEELNHILLDKIHNEGKDKRKEHEIEYGIVSYKCKGKKLNFLIAKVNLLQELK